MLHNSFRTMVFMVFAVSAYADICVDNCKQYTQQFMKDHQDLNVLQYIDDDYVIDFFCKMACETADMEDLGLSDCFELALWHKWDIARKEKMQSQGGVNTGYKEGEFAEKGAKVNEMVGVIKIWMESHDFNPIPVDAAGPSDDAES